MDGWEVSTAERPSSAAMGVTSLRQNVATPGVSGTIIKKKIVSRKSYNEIYLSLIDKKGIECTNNIKFQSTN